MSLSNITKFYFSNTCLPLLLLLLTAPTNHPPHALAKDYLPTYTKQFLTSLTKRLCIALPSICVHTQNACHLQTGYFQNSTITGNGHFFHPVSTEYTATCRFQNVVSSTPAVRTHARAHAQASRKKKQASKLTRYAWYRQEPEHVCVRVWVGVTESWNISDRCTVHNDEHLLFFMNARRIYLCIAERGMNEYNNILLTLLLAVRHIKGKKVATIQKTSRVSLY